MSTGGKAVVLSGGGAYGAFQVGMLNALVNDLGIDFDIIRGVSVGALNGAVLAQAAKQPDSLGNLSLAVSDLARLWKGIKGNRSVYRKKWTPQSSTLYKMREYSEATRCPVALPESFPVLSWACVSLIVLSTSYVELHIRCIVVSKLLCGVECLNRCGTVRWRYFATHKI